MIRNNPELPQDQKSEMLGVMENSGEQLLKMVEKVLDDEDGAEDHKDVHLIDSNLEELASKVLAVNNPKAILKEIDLQLKTDLAIKKVRIDPIKIEIALNNLVSNALKFTLRNGKVVLDVTTTEDFITFKVTDSGIGIPDNLINKLFSQDEHSDQITNLGTEGEIGTGLGLDVVQNYVELHQGKVGVESEEGIGTTFFINIPLIKKI
jgi:signal transduction histidine kinase